MAEVYKRLAVFSPNDTYEHVLYTSPVNTSVTVSNLTVTNYSTSDQLFTLNVYPLAIGESTVAVPNYTSPTVNSFYYQATISANTTTVFDPGIVLDQQNTLVVKGALGLNISLFGTEVTPTNSYKILGQVSSTANSNAKLYTVPTGKQTLVRSINITNTAATSAKVNVAISTGAQKNSFQMTTSTTPSKIAMSTDGVNWAQKAVATGIFPADWAQFSVYGSDRFLAIRYYSSSTTAGISPDGLNWTATSLPFITSGSYTADIVYGAGKFAISTTYGVGVVGVSTDGVTWSSTTASTSNLDIIIYANNRFVAMGASGNYATSTNGTTWTSGTTTTGLNVTALSYGAGVFLAVCSNTALSLTSKDGINWTTFSTPLGTTYGWQSLVYGAGVFVLTGFTTTYATSTDGINWISRTLPLAPVTGFKQLAFNGNMFLCISSTQINYMTSTDGISWTVRSTPSAQPMARVTASSVPVSFSDYILSSATVSPNQTVTLKAGYTLNSSSNSTMYVSSDTSGVSFSAYGVEF